MDDSPVSYLKRYAMTGDRTWASDVEIVAAFCMLNSDIFIVTELHDAAKLWKQPYGIDILVAPIALDIQCLSPLHIQCKPQPLRTSCSLMNPDILHIKV